VGIVLDDLSLENTVFVVLDIEDLEDLNEVHEVFDVGDLADKVLEPEEVVYFDDLASIIYESLIFASRTPTALMSKTRLDIEEEVLDARTRSSYIEDEVLDIGNLADKVLEQEKMLDAEDLVSMSEGLVFASRTSSLMSKTLALGIRYSTRRQGPHILRTRSSMPVTSQIKFSSRTRFFTSRTSSSMYEGLVLAWRPSSSRSRTVSPMSGPRPRHRGRGLNIENQVLDARTRSSYIEDEVLDVGNLADKVLEPDKVLNTEHEVFGVEDLV
jgi:hypothetical protein